MKKILILFPILTLLIAGCSLTQKPVVDNSASNQSASLSQEQANNLNAQIQEVKKEEIGKQIETPAETQLKKFVREKYSFYAPKEWMESSVILSGSHSNGCELYSINYGGDGHRTGGSIDIRTKSCFASVNLMSPINPNKENTEKNGYYIIAKYDSITGTTPSEELKTKEVYKKVVETFTLNNETTQIKVYFGKGSQGKYSLVNVQTGETQEFLPAGYTLLNQQNYQMFPTFLILQKDNDLYSYSIENKITNSIFGSFNGLNKLKKNEQARVYASMTEKDKFIIRIDTLDLSQVSEFNGLSPVLSTRTYSFDASINKLVSIANGKFNGCAEYDSKNQRFFTWPCGEGIGSAGPLSISDLNGNVQKQIITAGDFGLPNDDLIHIEFKNGLFFAFNNSQDIKIIVITPTSVSPTKEIYTATEQVKSQISDISTYSMGIDRSTNTLIIGGNSYILLLRFDSNNQITQSTYIPDKEIYANFIFPNAGKLYYQTKDNIRVVNLNSWQIEKSIPSSGKFSEITLFAL